MITKKLFIEKSTDDFLNALEWNELTEYVNEIADEVNEGTGGGLQNLAPVATSGNYNDLEGKPNLANVATTGSYSDLTNKPEIPEEQIQSDWNLTNSLAKDYIKNKPNIGSSSFSGDYNDLANKPTLFSGNYNDLTNKPTIPGEQILADWNLVDILAKDFIKNKPTIPAALIQVDWNLTDASTRDFIKNKPSIPAADEEDITNSNGNLKLKNRTSATGKNMIIVRASDDATIFSAADTIYVIQHVLDLNNSAITIPQGCTLRFDGGKIINGTILYNRTFIEGFDKSYLNITISGGAIANKQSYLKYYGTSSSVALSYVLSSGALGIGSTILIDGAIDGSFTSALVLDGDVIISANSGTNGYITIMGIGKNTQIMTNGYCFKGLYDYTKYYDSSNNWYDETASGRTQKHAGGIRFINLMFYGEKTAGEYIFECSSLMRLSFDHCFIRNCTYFCYANKNIQTDDYWMQSVRITNCYARGVTYIIYSANACFDINVLNTVVESSDNFFYSGKSCNNIVIKHNCIEGLSGKVVECIGLIACLNIGDNYFEDNVYTLDMSGATYRIDAKFINNFIGSGDSYRNPIVIMPTNVPSSSDCSSVLIENNLRGPVGITVTPIVSGTNTENYLIVRNNPNFTIDAPYCLIDRGIPTIKLWRGTLVLYDALSPNYDNDTIYIIS